MHAEAHRPTESPTPQYFSRHYYDLAMLLGTEEGQAAATDFDLLAQVVKHKSIFFRSSWSNYGTARPGTLRLLPNAARIKDLRADYREMAPMMFDEQPSTPSVLQGRRAARLFECSALRLESDALPHRRIRKRSGR